MVSQELVDLMQDLDDDGLVLLDRPTIDAARAGGVLSVLFQLEFPACDLCRHYDSVDIPAAFDCHTGMGIWGNVCHSCYKQLNSPELGPGRGQRLMLHSTVEAVEDEVFEDIEELKDITFDGDVLDFL